MWCVARRVLYAEDPESGSEIYRVCPPCLAANASQANKGNVARVIVVHVNSQYDAAVKYGDNNTKYVFFFFNTRTSRLVIVFQVLTAVPLRNCALSQRRS